VVSNEFAAVAGIATVGGDSVGVEPVTIGVGGTTVADDLDVGAEVQAVTKTTPRMSTVI